MNKILVVDDEPSIVLLLKSRLSAAGFQVITANDGIDALNKVTGEKPDLVLLDVLMPGMTGFQVVEKMKEAVEDIAHIPIIIMSAKHSMANVFDLADIYAFIPKPFEAADIIPEIRAAIGMDTALAVAPTKEPEENSAAGQPHEEDNAVLLGTQPFILNKIKDYLTGQGYSVVVAYDGHDLLEKLSILKPRFAFVQYWEDTEVLNAGQLYEDYKHIPQSSKISFFTFVTQDLSIDAAQAVPFENVLDYHESADLLRKIGKLIAP
ncbi:MAG: response regulator [Candidatus Omnitrophica bacterium]|nr:response regulator [Candidatus Omnitrophota bacterium]